MTVWLAACCGLSCPVSSVRPRIWVANSRRSSYWMPAEVVHCVPWSGSPGTNVWVAFSARLRLRLDDLLSTTVPGWPSFGSNCSSGGETKLLSCWK